MNLKERLNALDARHVDLEDISGNASLCAGYRSLAEDAIAELDRARNCLRKYMTVLTFVPVDAEGPTPKLRTELATEAIALLGFDDELTGHGRGK